MRDILTPVQAEIEEMGLLESPWPVILQLPTGAGKTFLSERAIHRALESGGRAIYVTPLRAQAAELGARWSTRFAPHQVGVFTSDRTQNGAISPSKFRTARLLVMTPERLDACTRTWRSHWGWIPEVDLLVVDELHLLGDDRDMAGASARGARLEGALGRFFRLNPFARFLGMSATLGNRGQLADWLHGVEYHSPDRSIPLQFNVVRYRKAEEKPDLLAQTVEQSAQVGGQSLIFVSSRRRAEIVAQNLIERGVVAAHHHAGLLPLERDETERRFRHGAVRALVATATLEMGVNLPVRQVVLYDLHRFSGDGFEPLSVTSVWQRAGRAGRRGLDPYGEAVLFAPAWDRIVENYARGEFEQVQSGLRHPRALGEQIVAELASGLCRTRSQLERAFSSSLASSQGLLPNIGLIVSDMERAGMLVETPDAESNALRFRLQATRLGRIAARQMLAPATIVIFRDALEILRKDELTPTFLDWLLLLCTSPDAEPVLPLDWEDVDSLSRWLESEPSIWLGKPRAEVLKWCGASGGRRLLSSLHMARTLRLWSRTGDVVQTARECNCYPFEVTLLCESAERLLLALEATLKAWHADEERNTTSADDKPSPWTDQLRALRAMLAMGLDEEAATLTFVRGIGNRWAKRLHTSGITDIEVLAQSEPTALAKHVEGIGTERAETWILQANALLCEKDAFALREWKRGTHQLRERQTFQWPTEVDSYRLRRALDLSIAKHEDWFEVWGGTEPHRVHRSGEIWDCDCADFAQTTGHTCKHILRARLLDGDKMLEPLVSRLVGRDDDRPLDLYDLWFDGRSAK